jgi:hypothetical protein
MCKDCKEVEKKNYVVNSTHKPLPCEYFTETKGKKIFCTGTTTRGKYCKACVEAMKDYTLN